MVQRTTTATMMMMMDLEISTLSPYNVIVVEIQKLLLLLSKKLLSFSLTRSRYTFESNVNVEQW